MKCILHIGTEKTGTTSLQKFLHLNRKTLAGHGYLYTKSAGMQNNRALSGAAYNVDRRDDYTNLRGIHSSTDLIAYQTATINALRNELKQVTGIHTVIFSSEHIQSRLRTDEELSRLKSILNGLGLDQISIVVYLRAPVDIATSLYSTAVNFGETKSDPPGPDDEYYRNICDHRNTLTRYRSTFGTDAIIPRIYSKAEFVNGSLFDDFAEAIGLPFSKNKYVIPKPQNESMTVLGLEILRRINQDIPMFGPDQRPNLLRENIQSYVAKHLNDGDRYRMPATLRQHYEDAFRDSNEWVRSEYFPDRQALFETTQTPCSGESRFQPSELDQIAHMISDIWSTKSRDGLGFYKRRAYHFVKTIWHQKRIAQGLTGRWRRT